MKINRKVLHLRELIKKVLKSEASIIVLYLKSDPSFSKHIIIQKFREANSHTLPIYKSKVDVEIEDNGNCKNIVYEIGHIYNSNQPTHIFMNEYRGKRDFDLNDWINIDINSTDSSVSEDELCNNINLTDLDLTHYYKLINIADFKQKFYNYFYNKKSDHYHWDYEEFYGLFKKQKYFTQQVSDFGSENLFTIILSNSKFICSKQKIFNINLDPSGNFSKDFDKYIEEIFEYFYEHKKMVCINFDSMPLSDAYKRTSVFYENRSITPSDKLYILPKHFLSETFILSTQIIDL